MFSTKGQEVKQGGGTAKSLQAGVVYAHIHSGQVRTSNKGDKKTLELVLEGPASEGFEGWAIDKNNPDGPKYTGQSSRVSATIWTDQFNDSNVSKNEIMYKLAVIASELGLRAFLLPIPVAATMANGVASPKAHGQAMTSTSMA